MQTQHGVPPLLKNINQNQLDLGIGHSIGATRARPVL